MAPSLPLEPQHDILKLAIPPFSYRSLSSRRETCRRFALIHRSWTPIAQAELQRCFRIKGLADHAERQAEKALVARALEEDWPVEDLVIEDDGVPIRRGRTTALPHPLLKKVKRAVVGTVFSEAALRPSTMPNLRELTIVEIPVENKQWWPDSRVPSTLFYPSLTRLRLVKITLHSLPPLPHLDTLLLTDVFISSGAEDLAPNSLPILRSLGCKTGEPWRFVEQLLFLAATLSSLQRVVISLPPHAPVEAAVSSVSHALLVLPSSGILTLRTAAAASVPSLEQINTVKETGIDLRQETYAGEEDDFDLEDWRPE